MVASTTPPPMSLLDRQIADAKHRLAHADNDDLRFTYAERIVGLRFERGDFPMIQVLDFLTRHALVVALLKENP